MINKDKRKITVNFYAMAPISHGEFQDADTGNIMMFRRIANVQLPEYTKIPVVSGNAIRGVIRRQLMKEVLETANITYNTFLENHEERTAKRVWDKLYAMICCGGTLDGKMEDGISPEDLRVLREWFPVLSLLGSAMYDKLLAGTAYVGFAYLMCEESLKTGLTNRVEKYVDIKAEDAIIEISHSRLPERENANPEITGVKPMPYTAEALAPGSILQTRISLIPSCTEIERAALIHGIKNLEALGGKLAGGFGQVDTESSDIDDSIYIEWLNERKEGGKKHAEFKENLLALADRLK